MLKIINGLYNIKGTQYVTLYYLWCCPPVDVKLSNCLTKCDNYLPIYYGSGALQNMRFERSVIYG